MPRLRCSARSPVPRPPSRMGRRGAVSCLFASRPWLLLPAVADKTGGPGDAHGHQPPDHPAEHAMTLLSHLGRPTVGFPSYVLRRPPRAAVEPQDDDEQPLLGGRVFAVQRLGAMSVGLFLL